MRHFLEAGPRREHLRSSINVIITGWDASTPELEEKARLGTGRRLWTRRGHNLVVEAGRNLIRDLLDGDAVNGITHFALGTSATPVLDTDVALGGEALRDVVTQRISSASVLTIKYFLSSTLLNGTTIREAGLFNAASGPTMFARYLVDPVIVKDNTIAVTFSWVITLASA